MIEAISANPSPEQIWRVFETEYLNATGDYGFISYDTQSGEAGSPTQALTARITFSGQTKTISGQGSGPLAGFIDAIKKHSGLDLDLASYREHMIGTGSHAEVAAYVELRFPSGRLFHGAGIDTSMAAASLKAVVSAVNRALRLR
jgi:2-isopropylmalate synthase